MVQNPASRISDVFRLLNIESKEDRELALNLPQLKLSFRSKRDILESEVPKNVLSKVSTFSKTYLSLSSDEIIDSQLVDIRNKIGSNRDYRAVAKVIRTFLDISDSTPFDYSQFDYAFKKYGINLFFVPFSSFGFFSQENTLRALTANKANNYLVLCDSDRTLDEIMFDATHELVHIFTGTVGEIPNDEVEKFVDLVAEELIYPESFLTKEFPFLLEDGKRATPDLFLKHNFRKLIESSTYIAPRGIAKTLITLGLISENQKVYTWMHDEEHEHYLKFYGKSLSKIGQIDFDFTDTFKYEDFVKNIVLNNIKKYPLFYLLARSLVRNKITHKAFADIFGMDYGDVDELKKELSKIDTL